MLSSISNIALIFAYCFLICGYLMNKTWVIHIIMLLHNIYMYYCLLYKLLKQCTVLQIQSITRRYCSRCATLLWRQLKIMSFVSKWKQAFYWLTHLIWFVCLYLTLKCPSYHCANALKVLDVKGLVVSPIAHCFALLLCGWNLPKLNQVPQPMKKVEHTKANQIFFFFFFFLCTNLTNSCKLHANYNSSLLCLFGVYILYVWGIVWFSVTSKYCCKSLSAFGWECSYKSQDHMHN